jgi:hypothetical protein
LRKRSNVLIKNGTFSLPDKKELLKNDAEYEVILTDSTETPTERPKKTKKILFRKKEKTYAENSDCH